MNLQAQGRAGLPHQHDQLLVRDLGHILAVDLENLVTRASTSLLPNKNKRKGAVGKGKEGRKEGGKEGGRERGKERSKGKEEGKKEGRKEGRKERKREGRDIE